MKPREGNDFFSNPKPRPEIRDRFFIAMQKRLKIKIKEQSLVARLAARKMKAGALAIVFGRTIHLWNISRREFLRQPSLMVHEVEHVRQYGRHGFLPFLFLYLADWIRKGYYNNRFEVEARAAETKAHDLEDIEFV